MSSMDMPQGTPRHVNWSRAFLAGLAATVIMTIVMLVMGMNLMKDLGSMIVGSGASPGLQYAVGGTVHLMIGLVYGFVFAWLFGRVIEWNRFTKGVVYGLAIAGIAFVAMPLMSSMIGGGGAANPCNPCQMKSSQPATNPCAPKNPCGASAANPCQPGGGATNPCNPCGGGGPMGGVLSLVNHLIYALTLAFVYKAR